MWYFDFSYSDFLSSVLAFPGSSLLGVSSGRSSIYFRKFWPALQKKLGKRSFLTRLRLKGYGGQAADYPDITDQRANDKNRKPTWCPRNMRMKRKRYILPKFSRLFASLVGAKSLPPSPSSFRTLSPATAGRLNWQRKQRFRGAHTEEPSFPWFSSEDLFWKL